MSRVDFSLSPQEPQGYGHMMGSGPETITNNNNHNNKHTGEGFWSA